jgi:hypothetical protein
MTRPSGGGGAVGPPRAAVEPPVAMGPVAVEAWSDHPHCGRVGTLRGPGRH